MKPRRTCFVVSPIGRARSATRRRSDLVYNTVITRALGPLGYKVIRADHLPEPGIITHQIVSHVVNDDLVVADLTDHNPNVFYELALRHALRKPVIQLIKEGQPVPFDVSPSRVVYFDETRRDSLRRARNEVVKQARWFRASPKSLATPIPDEIEFAGGARVFHAGASLYRAIVEEIKRHNAQDDRSLLLGALHGHDGDREINRDPPVAAYKHFDDAHLRCVLAKGPKQWDVRDIFNITTEKLLRAIIEELRRRRAGDSYEARAFCSPKAIPHLAPLVLGRDCVFLALDSGKYQRVDKGIMLPGTRAAAFVKDYFESLWRHPNIVVIRSKQRIEEKGIEDLRRRIRAWESCQGL